LDFGINFEQVSLRYDNESAMKIATNIVQRSRIKHTDICHHFIRDHRVKGDIEIESVDIDDELADIFNKTLDKSEVLQAKK